MLGMRLGIDLALFFLWGCLWICLETTFSPRSGDSMTHLSTKLWPLCCLPCHPAWLTWALALRGSSAFCAQRSWHPSQVCPPQLAAYFAKWVLLPFLSVDRTHLSALTHLIQALEVIAFDYSCLERSR